MDNEKRVVEMTTAEAEAFAAFQKQQEKERIAQQRKENREVYSELVDDEIATALPELRALSDQIKAVKAKVFENFKEVLRMKSEVMQLTTDTQRSHTFTHSNGSMRLTLGVNAVDDWRDTVEDGITMVKQYIESLATDDKSKMLVNTVLRLLSRDQKGTLKASRVLQLRRMAEETQDDTFIEGVRIIEESYQPSTTKTFIRAEFKDDKGWHIVPLSVTEADD